MDIQLDLSKSSVHWECGFVEVFSCFTARREDTAPWWAGRGQGQSPAEIHWEYKIHRRAFQAEDADGGHHAWLRGEAAEKPRRGVPRVPLPPAHDHWQGPGLWEGKGGAGMRARDEALWAGLEKWVWDVFIWRFVFSSGISILHEEIIHSSVDVSSWPGLAPCSVIGSVSFSTVFSSCYFQRFYPNTHSRNAQHLLFLSWMYFFLCSSQNINISSWRFVSYRSHHEICCSG